MPSFATRCADDVTRLALCTSLTPRALPLTRRCRMTFERPSSRKGAGPEKHAQNGVLESLPFLQNLRVPPPGPRPRAELRARFAKVLERLLAAERRPGRAQRARGADSAPSPPSPLRPAPLAATKEPQGCPREPRQRPPGAPFHPPGLAGRPQPRQRVSVGVGASPRPRTSSPSPPGGVSAPLENVVKL